MSWNNDEIAAKLAVLEDAAAVATVAEPTFNLTGTGLVSTFSHTFTVADPVLALVRARETTTGASVYPTVVAANGDITFGVALPVGTWQVTAVGPAL